jgi:uncharacterized protein (DUF885 family)
MYAQRPAYFLSYLVGFNKIQGLRERLENAGSLGMDSRRAFFDKMLSVGTIPFRLVEELLL